MVTNGSCCLLAALTVEIRNDDGRAAFCAPPGCGFANTLRTAGD
jgi:hypothetical protein